MYRMCLLKNEVTNDEISKFLKIEHAQLGRKIHHTEANWEIRGVCSAICTHDDMIAYVERYKTKEE